MADHRTTRPSDDHRLLNESLELLIPFVDELTAAFYDRLFAEHPNLRAMFPPVLDPQRERLLSSIITLVTDYDRPQALLPALTAMGQRHARYGVQLEDYAAVGAVLLSTLRAFAGATWTPAYQGAWVRAYAFAAGCMMQGALVDEEGERLAA